MKVQFLLEDGDLLAVFPENKKGKWVDVYSQNGEHATADYRYLKDLKQATREQFQPLLEILQIRYPRTQFEIS